MNAIYSLYLHHVLARWYFYKFIKITVFKEEVPPPPVTNIKNFGNLVIIPDSGIVIINRGLKLNRNSNMSQRSLACLQMSFFKHPAMLMENI
jgi:hypothetical protein